ncbi:MAG: hypothetical protein NDJ89_18000 [Oligoflexia bacterium]|nr:hypothetical protein [Oligoflexia bacterium]
MALRRFFGIFLCMALAAGITAGVNHLDRLRAEKYEKIAALRWARQITSQAESVAMNARAKGERNPLRAAVDYLTQGVEPRIIRVTQFDSLPSDGSGDLELFKLDRAAGVFDYSKVMEHANRSGIRVQLDVGYSGFLGSHSKLGNDLSLAGFLGAVWLLVISVFPGLAGKTPRVKAEAIAPVMPLPVSASVSPRIRAPREGKLKAGITVWLAQARPALTLLGTSVRDVLRDALALTDGARRAILATESLRSRIHGGLNELHSGRQTLKRAVQLAVQLEALSRAPLDESSRRRLAELIAQLKQTCVGGEAAMRELEIRIEPWALDADQLVTSQQGVIDAAQRMGGSIQKAKEQLVVQVKQLQELGEQVAPKAPKSADSAETAA